jgi:hypothetical protein
MTFQQGKFLSFIGLLTSALLTGTSMANETKITQPSTDKQNINKVRIATFNVSMEALNYLPYVRGVAPEVKGNELAQALKSQHQQIRNIAEIIQRVNPDIILLNEFDRAGDEKNIHQSLKNFINDYLAISQNGQTPIEFPYFYQAPSNTGIPTTLDLNNDGQKGDTPQDTYGFGYFSGHFAMAFLSKYPLDEKKIRTFQQFKWKDMPNALQPIDPKTNKPWYTEQAWQQFRLSSKSHWDIPVKIDDKIIHVLASHPTPPVFDGPEDRNGKRNHDEIRFWHDYITPNKGTYIYDDQAIKGGLSAQQRFVILGDQNASNTDGDAMNGGISSLLNHDSIQDAMPKSAGGIENKPENINSKHHTAHWGMRADYVLPSTFGWSVKDSGVFWPAANEETFRLVKDRAASSDHRLVWVDLEIK